MLVSMSLYILYNDFIDVTMITILKITIFINLFFAGQNNNNKVHP